MERTLSARTYLRRHRPRHQLKYQERDTSEKGSSGLPHCDFSAMDAQCQCGNIKFRTPLPAPLRVFVCHCSECRHQSSSAFGISAIFPPFEIESPDQNAITVYIRSTASGKNLECLLCSKCGSRFIHKYEWDAHTFSVKGGCLEGLCLKDATHIWCKEAVIEIPPSAVAFEEEPPKKREDSLERLTGSS